MELSQQKKQILFKTCYIVLVLAIVGVLCCKLYEDFFSVDIYNEYLSLYNSDSYFDLNYINIYKLFLAISIVDIVKNFILISILLLYIIVSISKLKNKRLIYYTLASLFITISLVLNIVSYIIKYKNSLLFSLAYSGQPLLATMIIMFIILILSITILISLIKKEIKFIKDKSISSDPTSVS